MSDKPGFLEMIRAPFLFAIIVPLVIGTITSVSITNKFHIIGFLLVFIIGISLHISTNVYNDIYDTLQGADNNLSKESDYSGGSGILVDHPDLFPKMFLIARSGIIVGVAGGIILLFFIDKRLWPFLITIIGISAFLSKFYTAPPFKFAYRGLGEIFVWLGFGPFAILLASIGQNLGIHPTILVLMPITGLSTLFIVWMGEMVDFETDKFAGKY
ncbi:MAG: prenyltransferase, partial [Thermoplasmatota archaeon]